MTSRRILITGLSSYLGGRLAQALERTPSVQAIVGIDTEDPRHQLERTEFVRVELEPELIRRILAAAAIDTVIDTRLVADPLSMSVGDAHRVNIGGTNGLLAACAPGATPVRKLIFKSAASYYGYASSAPAFLSEDMEPSPPRGALERDVRQAESALRRFAAENPDTVVTVLRFADVIGGEARSSHETLFNLPVIPSILGFDPRWQLIHGDDVVEVLAHAAHQDIPGTYNAAADGVLALSEIASLLGKPLLPILPPWGTGLAARQLRRVGLRVPLELLGQLRYGRGLENRRLKATGYHFRYTTREAVLKLRAQQRLRPLLGSGGTPYRYEREVEEFLRRSPSVRRGGGSANADGVDAEHDAGSPASAYDALSAPELIDVISSLELDALTALRDYEVAHSGRSAVLEALDRALARKSAAP